MFVVLADNVVSGVVFVNAIDRLHRKADWAFYLDKNVRGGLFEKLNCKVIATHETVVKLHKKFGFEEEGFRRENIVKDENRIGVFFLGLTRSGWRQCNMYVFNKYMKGFEKTKIEVEYNVE